MSRIFNQKNVWGTPGGEEAQRSDLWMVDFSQAVQGLNNQIRSAGTSTLEVIPFTVEPYFVSSISMPCLRVKAEEFRRDSRPYFMPTCDEALPEIRITFVMDAPVNAKTSKVYRFLETWRAFVRAGRGAMGNEKTVNLNSRYRVDFKFPATVVLLRGCAKPQINNISSTLGNLSSEYYGSLDNINEELSGLNDEEKSRRLTSLLNAGGMFENVQFQSIVNDLEDCAVFQLEGLWLSGFKVSDLDYSKGNEIARIEATFYADNMRDLNQ